MFYFSQAIEIRKLCAEHGFSVGELTLRREIHQSGSVREVLVAKMASYFERMRQSIRKGLEITERSPSGLSGGDAGKMMAYAGLPHPLLGASFARTVAYGLAVLETNTNFGRIIATPTAGSAGILPAVLLSLQESHHLSDETIVMGLFAAAGAGYVIGENACFSGAQGGCQAEVGSASSMAAAAIVECLGGTVDQTLQAAALALKNTLGLVCDPIGGFVEAPCVKRNGMFAVHSFLAASMALAGISSAVPFDEVVLAMRDIGRRMPRALKETSEGGLAATPTALCFAPAPPHSSASPKKT